MSAGFRQQVAAYVEKVQRIHSDDRTPEQDRFAQLQLNSEGDDLKNPDMFDGLPLVNPDTNLRFYDGDPIKDSNNFAVQIGVAFPVDLMGFFGE